MVVERSMTPKERTLKAIQKSRLPPQVKEHVVKRMRPEPKPPEDLPSKQDIQQLKTRTETIEKQIIKDPTTKYTTNGKELTGKQLIEQLKQTKQYLRDYNRTKKRAEQLYFDPYTGKPKWEEIPLEQRKYYPGAKEHFAKKTPEQQVSLLGKSKVMRNVELFHRNRTIPQEHMKLIKHEIPYFMAKVWKKLRADERPFEHIRGEEVIKAVKDVMWEHRTEIDPNDKWFGKLHPVEQAAYNFFQSARQTTVGVVTFPATVSEFVGYELPGLSSLKKKAEKFEQKSFVGMPGGISQAAIMLVGSEEEKKWLEGRREKYGWLTVPSVGGEAAGFYTGAKTIHMGKTFVTRTAIKSHSIIKPQFLKIPKMPQLIAKIPKPKHPLPYYKPSEFLKRTWYERVKGIPEVREGVWLSKPVKGGWTFSTPKETLKGFRRHPGVKPGTYEFGTATGARWGRYRPWWRKIKPGDRPGEMPGTYISPKGMVQRRFLRLKRYELPTYKSKIGLFPKFKRPAVMTGEIKIARLPWWARRDVRKAVKFTKPKKGKAFITVKHETGGFEPEATITPRTPYKWIKTPEYFIESETGKLVTIEKLGVGLKIPKYSTTTKLKQTYIKHFTIPSSYKGPTPVTFKPYIPYKHTPSKPSKISYPKYLSYPSKISISLYSSVASKPSKTYVSFKPSPPRYFKPPSYPSVLSEPSLPSYPSKPSYISTPSKPSIPSYLSTPSYPTISTRPSYPYYKPSKKSKRKVYRKKKKEDVWGYREREFRIPKLTMKGVEFQPIKSSKTFINIKKEAFIKWT